jgi:ligand-binding SRPBCC domain-containing protein
MNIYTLEREIVVPLDEREAFAFFEDPRNLARITPPWLRFEIAAKRDIEMREGAVIDYTIRWMGISLAWKTTITAYDPPRFFVDEQTRGPYALWRHRHTLEPVPGGTRIADRVEYALPLGLLGRLAHWLVVRRQLEHIFAYRAKAVAGVLGGPTSPEK